mgnify:CR=1 FL=1
MLFHGFFSLYFGNIFKIKSHVMHGGQKRLYIDATDIFVFGMPYFI